MDKQAEIILNDFCAALNVNAGDVTSLSRKREHVDARFLIVDEIIKSLGKRYTLRKIGSWFNKPEKSAHCFALYCAKQAILLRKDKLFNTKYMLCQATKTDPSIYDHIPQF